MVAGLPGNLLEQVARRSGGRPSRGPQRVTWNPLPIACLAICIILNADPSSVSGQTAEDLEVGGHTTIDLDGSLAPVGATAPGTNLLVVENGAYLFQFRSGGEV